jgi:hypothetical protein
LTSVLRDLLTIKVVRRLPVLQSSAPEDQAAEARPQWQWVLIAGGLAATLWLPLSTIALPIGARLAASAFGLSATPSIEQVSRLSGGQRAGIALLTAGPVVLAFAVSCFSSGFLVGRFSLRAQSRTAAMGCFAAGAAAWSIAAASGGLSPWPVAVFSMVVLGAVSLGAGALGARLGSRKRPKG